MNDMYQEYVNLEIEMKRRHKDHQKIGLEFTTKDIEYYLSRLSMLNSESMHRDSQARSERIWRKIKLLRRKHAVKNKKV